MMMILFSWLGYVGFLFAYLFFKENIPVKIKVFKNGVEIPRQSENKSSDDKPPHLVFEE